MARDAEPERVELVVAAGMGTPRPRSRGRARPQTEQAAVVDGHGTPWLERHLIALGAGG